MQRFRTNCTSDYINRLASIYLIPFYLFIAQPIEGRGVLHPPTLSCLGHLPASTKGCCVPWNPTCPPTTELPWGSDTPHVLCHRVAVSPDIQCCHKAAVGPTLLMSPVPPACACVFLSVCMVVPRVCAERMHLCAYTSKHACKHTYVCTHLHTHRHVHMPTWLHVHLHPHVQMQPCTNTPMFAHQHHAGSSCSASSCPPTQEVT